MVFMFHGQKWHVRGILRLVNSMLDHGKNHMMLVSGAQLRGTVKIWHDAMHQLRHCPNDDRRPRKRSAMLAAGCTGELGRCGTLDFHSTTLVPQLAIFVAPRYVCGTA